MSFDRLECVQKSTSVTKCYSNSLSIYLIALGAFSLGMASYVTAGLIPLIEQDFKVSVSFAAQLVTVFTLAYGIGSPVIVALLPTNRQKSGILAALGLFVLANAASALATDFIWLVVFRALAGIGSGVYLSIGIATAASLSPHRRGKAIALVMGGMAAGTVLGVPVGLVLAENMGWPIAFGLVTILGLTALLGLILWLPELPNYDSVPLRKKLSLFVDRQVTVILAVSLFAAISSLGMYTFLAPLMLSVEYSGVHSITPFLWIWGLGGIAGSFLVGPLTERIHNSLMTLSIMLILGASLIMLPFIVAWSVWLAMVPIAVWGAVGWALQVPQNNQLLHVRDNYGDGHLAVALNESALYLGSAIGAAVGGVILTLSLPMWVLPVGAGIVAVVGALLQLVQMHQNRR
ncbi:MULTISPECIES: MFS transporter [unclassified Agarivorans]|uniref:MFS transporter n=1 Tax=unclassified Agarivorans TaxID=2636026 RepID=UPI003D7DAE22